MNKARRAKLGKIHDEIGTIIEQVEFLRDEEEESFENLPEGIQGSEKGEKMESNISDLEELTDLLYEAKDKIDEAITV